MIKTFIKVEGNFFNMTRAIGEKCTANMILSGERLKGKISLR